MIVDGKWYMVNRKMKWFNYRSRYIKEDPLHRTFVLITGAPRSGTTYLSSLLGGHSKVAILCENDCFWEYNVVGKPVVGNKLCVPNQIELNRRFNWRHRKRWHYLLAEILRPSRPCLLFHRLLFPLTIEDYLNIGARVIFVVRKFDDNVESIFKRHVYGFRYKYSESYARQMVEDALRTKHQLIKHWPDRVHVVLYDRLSVIPHVELRNVCDFIGIPYEESILRGASYNILYPDKY